MAWQRELPPAAELPAAGLFAVGLPAVGCSEVVLQRGAAVQRKHRPC
jgi:hypothetical protein